MNRFRCKHIEQGKQVYARFKLNNVLYELCFQCYENIMREIMLKKHD